MNGLNRSRIEYGQYHWPLVTGCRHGIDVCAVSLDCWARGIAHRFRQEFRPTLHPEQLAARMPRKPSWILVSFTGDMFGEWWRTPQVGEWDKLVLRATGIAAEHPEHRYLFLTKNPAAYALFNPWPANCWLGMSLTGAETCERQAAMWLALERAEARIRWLSYEPAIASLAVPIPNWLTWIVLGGWSRPRQPSMAGLRRTIDEAVGLGIPYWVKDNLAPIWTPSLRDRQEMPQL